MRHQFNNKIVVLLVQYTNSEALSNFKTIQNKLEQFIKRYYTNELLKGIILFFAIGLLYFLATLFVEYVLWLSPTGRTILFWLFVGVELALLAKFIIIPLAKLFKLQKGIDYKDASKIIGNHFPEVNDKLLNILQLNQNSSQTELLLASIEQKSAELKPVPFKLAVNFKQNAKYLKYAAIPVLILLVWFISGKYNWFSDSYERVVNYDLAYEPPAPFSFEVLAGDGQVLESSAYTIQVTTKGTIKPEDVYLVIGDKEFLLQRNAGLFEYTFEPPLTDAVFYFKANNVNSRNYELRALKTPAIQRFNMKLEYPGYTNKATEVIKGTGNATFPEGTRVTWDIKGGHTT